jgi:hypothetical protein
MQRNQLHFRAALYDERARKEKEQLNVTRGAAAIPRLGRRSLKLKYDAPTKNIESFFFFASSQVAILQDLYRRHLGVQCLQNMDEEMA